MKLKKQKSTMIIIPVILTIICILAWIAYIPIWPHTQNGEWGKDNTYVLVRRMLGLEPTGPYTPPPLLFPGKKLNR